MNILDLPTPSLIVDRGRVISNTLAMRQRMNELGVTLRPHAKTAKSAAVARLAHGNENPQGGLTISTLAEAAYFLDHGFSDLVYAVCVAPAKLDSVSALRDRGAALKIITDNVDASQAIGAHPGSHEVLVEIDCGEHRTGVTADGPELLKISDAVAKSGRSKIAGVLTHAGHSYGSRNGREAADIAEAERAAAVQAASRLREAGHATPIISVGSTPTAMHARHLDGVTEARPGVYVFQDLFQAGIGSCGWEDMALSVLGSVIARHPARGTLMLDTGGLALSKDRSTAALDGDGDKGFGLICDAAGGPLAGLHIAGVHQEHGEVKVDDPALFEKLPIGGKVRIFPNHACMTAAAYDTYHVVDGGMDIVDTWDRCNGW